MAGLAFVSELPAVKIGVAIRASGTRVREREVRVALRAPHFRVHPAQLIARAIVVKLRHAANGFPAGPGVAVFACILERAMRIVAVLPLGLRRGGLRRRRQCEERPKN